MEEKSRGGKKRIMHMCIQGAHQQIKNRISQQKKGMNTNGTHTLHFIIYSVFPALFHKLMCIYQSECYIVYEILYTLYVLFV